MKMKATAFTAATVAVASLLPSIKQVDTHTVSAQQMPTTKTGYINPDTTILYSNNKTDSDSIKNILPNTPVTILNTLHDYYKVNVNNTIGYIKKGDISFTKSTYQKQNYIVNANILNIRSKPTVKSSILDRLPNGTFISIQETKGDWYQISHNGQIGYVKKEFVFNTSQALVKGITVQNQSPYYVATPTLNVRRGAGTHTAVIGSLQNGTQIDVIETAGTWYKIRFGTSYGFVAKHYIIQKQPHNKQTDSSIPAVFKFPTQGTISSTFDTRWEQMHYGLDITAPGNVSIHAAASGKVIRSYYSASYGNVVFVAHPIKGKLYTTVYAHMKDRTVKAGDQVQAGQLLGHMGDTGHSYGQHLHFELHNGEWNFEKTNAVDPLPYLVR
ncbi:SH3 domain-containing protein [Bacillus gaemokensis]|uniref:Peptidase M24 n=1 Tax=Bacillus gaemokensis TaxID=574375 RepID=A0A073KCL1_9BACI|nr:SH3 domain-containing protein [Bacillus gaemokensis]KEK24202.1 peptidase M24 [Bacillus gaemokensis]KYG38283.1 peptidase M24 [Bacillus gaemokensis]